MTPIERWSPGDQIVMRSTWGKDIQAAWPVTVVEDSEEALLLFLASGTVYKLRTYAQDSKYRMPVGDYKHMDREWKSDLLRIMIPGDNHAYLGFWDRDHLFNRWYVNLEQEYRRTRIGIAFVDHFLDIVIQPDLRTWRWKDEDELTEAVSVGLISQEQADAIKSEGYLVLGRLEENLPPFGQGWESWLPDSTWPIPTLPSDWHTPIQ